MMDELVWSDLQNSTNGLEDADVALNSTVSTTTRWRNAAETATEDGTGTF